MSNKFISVGNLVTNKQGNKGLVVKASCGWLKVEWNGGDSSLHQTRDKDLRICNNSK